MDRMEADRAPEVVVLADRHGPVKRALLAAFGLLALTVPPADLWHGLLAPSLIGPIFWLIVLGAAFVGLTFLGGAVFAPSTELTVAAGRITLVRANLVRRTEDRLRPDEIRDVRIRVHDWDSGPDTYSVEVVLSRGRPVYSADVPQRAEAEALADRLKAALGRR